MRSSDRWEGHGWCRRFFKWVGWVWVDYRNGWMGGLEEWVDGWTRGMGGLIVGGLEEWVGLLWVGSYLLHNEEVMKQNFYK
jgi:hypothetical protein